MALHKPQRVKTLHDSRKRAKSVRAASSPRTVAASDDGRVADSYSFADTLGVAADEFGRVIGAIRSGLLYSAFERLRQAMAISGSELAELLRIPPRTLARRKEVGRFDFEESDRLARTARALDLAFHLFEGDLEAARSWLQAPQRALGGEKPIAICNSDAGIKEIENLILRLEHGVLT